MKNFIFIMLIALISIFSLSEAKAQPCVTEAYNSPCSTGGVWMPGITASTITVYPPSPFTNAPCTFTINYAYKPNPGYKYYICSFQTNCDAGGNISVLFSYAMSLILQYGELRGIPEVAMSLQSCWTWTGTPNPTGDYGNFHPCSTNTCCLVEYDQTYEPPREIIRYSYGEPCQTKLYSYL